MRRRSQPRPYQYPPPYRYKYRTDTFHKYPMRRYEPNDYRRRWFFKVIASCVLFIVTLFIFQSQTPIARQAQLVITEVLEREFNFDAVAHWYEQTIGGLPVIIPTFSRDDSIAVGQPDMQSPEWQLPVNGTIERSYTSEHPYIVIGKTDSSIVTASADGLVTFVGERDGWGHCVIIEHAGGYETWYGSFETVRVAEADWVQRGQLLGKQQEGIQQLQFGIKQGGEFVNPLNVIQGE